MTTSSVANELLEWLRPGCARIEIAGSLRRGKADPKDIELVAIPKLAMVLTVVDIFGNIREQRQVSMLDGQLADLFGSSEWGLDVTLKRDGERYKRLKDYQSGICCDLFIVTEESWGVQMVIRTGPAEFSKEMVTRPKAKGMFVRDGRLWRSHRDGTETAIPTPDEDRFFKALGLPFIPPGERQAWMDARRPR